MYYLFHDFCSNVFEFCTSTIAPKLLSRPYTAPLQHQGPLPHKWATRRNGWNGLTGWMQWHRHKYISLSHLKLFSMLKNAKVLFFVRLRPVTQKNTFPFSGVTVIAAMKIEKYFLVPHWSRTNYSNVLFHFSTCWKALNEEMMECTCVCLIVSTQSAHFSHSA